MDNEQIKSLIEQLKAAGLDEDQIMGVFYETFEKGKMDRKDLETLANEMGYELTDEFKNDSTPDPIAAAGGENGETDLEDLKEIGPDESAEEFKEKIDDAAPVDADSEPETEEEEESTDEEVEENSDSDGDDGEEKDDDWEKAQKLFKI